MRQHPATSGRSPDQPELYQDNQVLYGAMRQKSPVSPSRTVDIASGLREVHADDEPGATGTCTEVHSGMMPLSNSFDDRQA